jgi:hypothetical protein
VVLAHQLLAPVTLLLRDPGTQSSEHELALKISQWPCSNRPAVAECFPTAFQHQTAWECMVVFCTCRPLWGLLFLMSPSSYKSWILGLEWWDPAIRVVGSCLQTVLCLPALTRVRKASLFFGYLNRHIAQKLPGLIVVKMCQVDPFRANHN